MLILCRVTDTAIAGRFVLEFTWLCDSVLFTMIDVPPDALLGGLFIWLYIACCLIFNLSFLLKISLWHITHGHKFLIMSVNSSRLAFEPLMLHCMILFVLQVCLGPIIILVGRCFASHVWFVDWLWLVGIVSWVSILPKGGSTFSYILVIFRLFHFSWGRFYFAFSFVFGGRSLAWFAPSLVWWFFLVCIFYKVGFIKRFGYGFLSIGLFCFSNKCGSILCIWTT